LTNFAKTEKEIVVLYGKSTDLPKLVSLEELKDSRHGSTKSKRKYSIGLRFMTTSTTMKNEN
jgi:hypothetical protein